MSALEKENRLSVDNDRYQYDLHEDRLPKYVFQEQLRLNSRILLGGYGPPSAQARAGDIRGSIEAYVGGDEIEVCGVLKQFDAMAKTWKIIRQVNNIGSFQEYVHFVAGQTEIQTGHVNRNVKAMVDEEVRQHNEIPTLDEAKPRAENKPLRTPYALVIHALREFAREKTLTNITPIAFSPDLNAKISEWVRQNHFPISLVSSIDKMGGNTTFAVNFTNMKPDQWKSLFTRVSEAIRQTSRNGLDIPYADRPGESIHLSLDYLERLVSVIAANGKRYEKEHSAESGLSR